MLFSKICKQIFHDFKDLSIYYPKYEIPHSVKIFYVIFLKVNGYITKDYDGSKYLSLVPANEKDKGLLKYEI